MDSALNEVTQDLPVAVDDAGIIDCNALAALRDSGDDGREQRRRCWWFVVWPSSCNVGKLFRTFDELHIPIVVSPLHRLDYKEDGTLAEPHYHIIVRFPHAKALGPVRKIVGQWLLWADGLQALEKDIDPVWYVRPVEDYAGCLRYLCHLDSPEKAKYPVNEVLTFGFADVSMLYAKSLADDVHAFAELLAICRENPSMSWSRFCNKVFDSGDMVLLRALKANGYMLRSYLADMKARDEEPNG